MNKPPNRVNPDFSSQLFQENLYQHYRNYLQATPVFCSDEGVIYLTRYSDCLELLSNQRFRRLPSATGSSPFSDAQRIQTPLDEMISQWMIFMDPPRHDLVRRGFMQPFGAKAIKQLEPTIQAYVRQLLNAFPSNEEVEFLQSFAYTLPILVIAKILGVPETDIDIFRSWSLLLTQSLDSGSEEDIRKGAEVALLFKDYFKKLLSERHNLSPDSLINTLSDNQSINLSADELLYGYVFLLWAGHETTKNLIANGMQLLAEHPAQLLRLQQQPDLIDNAIDEMLRFDSPLQKISRWSHEDIKFGEYFIPRGSMLTALIGAANRDESVFNEPDKFDIGRLKNRHIAFGSGIHHCLGAILAKTEARVAFSEIVPRLLSLEPAQHTWRTFSAFRSMEQLSIKVTFKC